MPALVTFDYAIVRVVPRVEREEFVNVGVLLFCPEHATLAARIELDEARVRALFADVDLELVGEHLEAFDRICRGGPEGGPIGELPQRERWHWLVNTRSDMLQTSAPHVGLCEAPAPAIERLLDVHVRTARRPA
ncbi:MAG: hypothetical protein JWP97_6452 [Labilithrix sp.]|nr:hypothetical protein [Labilithrix sp.]